MADAYRIAVPYPKHVPRPSPRPDTGTYGAAGPGSAEPSSIEELLDLLQPPPWHADAACKEHPELSWFPARGDDLRPAKAICCGCLVQAECAAAGMQQHDGIWGGLSERDRRRARRSAA